MVRPLYLGRNLDDLDKMITLPDTSTKSASTICNSIRTLLDGAEKANKGGDEELAYVYFMKYFGLIALIKKKPDFSHSISASLGPNRELTARLDRTGALKASLKRRYEQLGIKNTTKSAIEVLEEKMEETKATDDAKSRQMLVQCDELYKLIHDGEADILIVDCRPKDEYAASHLECVQHVSVPAENIKKGLSAFRLEDSLDTRERNVFAKRHQMKRIILIDWSSTAATPTSHKIWTLRDILLNWDPEVSKDNLVQITVGGYERFKTMYPMFTTNPKYEPARTAEPYAGLDGIEYPSMDAIKMKNDRVPSMFVDRSNKPSGYARSHEPSISVNDIISEKEKLIEKQLKDEAEALKLQTVLNETIQHEPKNDNVQDLRKWFNQQNEIEYQILQSENKRNDNNAHLNELDDQLKSIESSVPQTNDTSQAMRRVEEKENERARMEIGLSKLREENEQRLRVAREQKRHFQIPEDEAPQRPKQPAFDRSVKPLEPSNQQTIARNFSPEAGSAGRGLTGLKNLGNTCYMNSVLQCLSNLDSLTNYFLTGLFRKHLNRKSRTRGQIAEEYAALMNELWSGKNKSISPRDFRYVFGQYRKMFSGYEQQDSHEFLTILMDHLHLELQWTLDDTIARDKLNAADRAWREFVENKQSYIMETFFGQIRSTVKCCVCKHESATYEGFSNLSLELPQNSKQCDLRECMNMYFHGELISEWNCPKCKVKRDAIKKLDISRVPSVLVIHLKRFCADLQSSSNAYRKKQNYVRFQIDEFDISDYLTLSVQRMNAPSDFRLCAVSNHYGTMERGHYTAFCRNYKTEGWYKFDDCYVTQIDRSEVISSAAYILFYSCL